MNGYIIWLAAICIVSLFLYFVIKVAVRDGVSEAYKKIKKEEYYKLDK